MKIDEMSILLKSNGNDERPRVKFEFQDIDEKEEQKKIYEKNVKYSN